MNRYRRHIVSISIATIVLCALFAACASTNVSADAQGHISYGPSSCYQPDGSWDRVVIVGSTPYHTHNPYSLALKEWHNLGGAATGEAAVVSGINGRVDVFVRGTTGIIWSKYTKDNGATWTSWAKPGGADLKVLAGTSPAVCRDGNFIRLYWVDASSKALLETQYYAKDGGLTYFSSNNLGGICTSTPAAATFNVGGAGYHTFILVRGTSGVLWCRDAQSGFWTWKNCGEQLYSTGSTTGYGPALCMRASGSWWGLDMFWVDGNRALQYKQWDSATKTFVNKKSLGGICTSPPSAAYNPSQKSLWVEVRGTDNLIHGRTGTLSSPTAQVTFQGWSGPYKGPVT